MSIKSGGTILVYGATGVGKTLDVHHAFGKDTLTIVTERGALDCVEAHLGREPDTLTLFDTVNPYNSAIKTIEAAERACAQKRYKAVILDTGTALAERFFVRVSGQVDHDGRRLYPRVTSHFNDIILRLLNLPAWVVMICHEVAPKDQGGFIIGGPKLPGRDLVRSVPSMFSLVLRAVKGPMPGAVGNVRHYRCDQMDAQYIMKDRYGAAKRYQDLDLRPILWRIVRPGVDEPVWPPKPIRTQESEADQKVGF